MKKNSNNTVGIVTKLVTPIVSELGLELWDVRFEKEGSTWILRVILDNAEGISMTDCEAVSRPLDKLLDEADPIEQSYCLEVSSAGIERELTKEWHFEQSIGKKMRVKLIRPLDGEREFFGNLVKYEKDSIEIEGEDKSYTLKIADVAYIRWYAEF